MAYDQDAFDTAYDLVETAQEELDRAAKRLRTQALRRLRKLTPEQKEITRTKIRDLCDSQFQTDECHEAARLIGRALNKARWDK